MAANNAPNQNLPDSSKVVITASEVHEFFYCPYAWWFEDTSQSQLEQWQRGVNYHTEFANQQVSGGNPPWNWLLPIIALILAIVAGIFYFLLEISK